MSEIDDEIERKRQNIQREKEERHQQELRDRERQMWEEKFNAGLQMRAKKIEMEKSAKASLAKFPQLKLHHLKALRPIGFASKTCFSRKSTADPFPTKKNSDISSNQSYRR